MQASSQIKVSSPGGIVMQLAEYHQCLCLNILSLMFVCGAGPVFLESSPLGQIIVRGTTGGVGIFGSGSGLALPTTDLLRVFSTANLLGIAVTESRGNVQVTGAQLNSADLLVEKHIGPVLIPSPKQRYASDHIHMLYIHCASNTMVTCGPVFEMLTRLLSDCSALSE
jgi:hypothetical protein